MSALVAAAVAVVAILGSLVMIPWVGFMAVFVVLVLIGTILGHFWSTTYLEAAAWVSLKLLDPPGVQRLLPMGTWRLATVALAIWLVAIIVVPGLVAMAVLPMFVSGPGNHFAIGAVIGIILSAFTAVLHPMCPIAGCGD